ncbi:hypothetical protein [Proteus mirabilis]|uniref:hypothetical protein n=1 Tax=Proteus mirabilis TaxID=584 RepID=UPI00236246E7|nr:hypothetical protein [Proteus mirabilis]MDC9748665.1 hypothetical protein [Proteus mirabilis]
MKNPKLISKPFAQNGQKNVIPEKYETSMESNQATWDQGFGQITMLPVSAGGLPPKGQDFNGILNQMCETIVHISKGGAFKFSADYATAINGYPKGAILQSEDEKKYYQSIIDNNKVNFNTASQDQIKTSWKLVMTDDLLDQLSKKLESSAVVQSTGTSTTSVMSQKAVTDSFQPKGNYALKGESYTKSESDGKYQVKGDYATNTALNNKLDKTSVVQATGQSTTNVMSQKAVTDSFQPKGNYALKGESYTKSESDGKYQVKGDYADKSLTAAQSFNGSIDATNAIGAREGNRRIILQLTSGKREVIHTDGINGWYGAVFPDKTGTLALIGDSYTKAESNNIYQPKGNYSLLSQVMGIGQSYSDVTESRKINTVYKNTSGKGIIININGRSLGNITSTLIVNNRTAMTISGSDLYAINRNISVIIPEDASYELQSSSFTFVSWTELV